MSEKQREFWTYPVSGSAMEMIMITAIIAAIEKLKTAHRASVAQLDALFASLQHRAFRGEV